MKPRLLAYLPADIWVTPDDIRQGRKGPSSQNFRTIAYNMHRYVRQPFFRHGLDLPK